MPDGPLFWGEIARSGAYKNAKKHNLGQQPDQNGGPARDVNGHVLAFRFKQNGQSVSLNNLCCKC